MDAEKCQNDRKKPDYKLGERNLEVKPDLEFIDMLLNDLRLEAEPGVRGVVLDIAYTLARDKLVEAARFAKLSNRTNLTVEDLKMAHLEETDELKNCVQTLKNIDLTQEVLPKPCIEKGLMLPNWRNCQVGAMPELQTPETKPPPKVIHNRPSIVRRLPKGQSLVSVSGNTGGTHIKVIPSASKGSTSGAQIKVIPSTSKESTSGGNIKVIPSTSKGPLTLVADPAKASSEATKPSAISPPVSKKSRLN